MRIIALTLLSALSFSGCQYTFGDQEEQTASSFNEIAINKDFNFETAHEFELIFPKALSNQKANLFQLTGADTTFLGIYNLDGNTIRLSAEQGIDVILAQPINFMGNGDIVFNISGVEEDQNPSPNLCSNIIQSETGLQTACRTTWSPPVMRYLINSY